MIYMLPYLTVSSLHRKREDICLTIRPSYESIPDFCPGTGL